MKHPVDYDRKIIDYPTAGWGEIMNVAEREGIFTEEEVDQCYLDRDGDEMEWEAVMQLKEKGWRIIGCDDW